jgi:hypothetical protein
MSRRDYRRSQLGDPPRDLGSMEAAEKGPAHLVNSLPLSDQPRGPYAHLEARWRFTLRRHPSPARANSSAAPAMVRAVVRPDRPPEDGPPLVSGSADELAVA